MKYKPDQIQTHEIKDATLEVGKFSKKVVHVAAGAPAKTNDTGEGYEQGSIWVDSSNGDMYICTDHSAENSVWQNMEGDDVNLNQFTAGSSTGFLMGGIGPGGTSDTIHTLSLTSDGDSVATSDELTNTKYSNAGAKSSTYFFSAGDYGPGPGPNVAIDSYTISSPHTYGDWGEITVSTGSTANMASANNDSSAWVVGGYPTGNDTIQKFDTSSASDTTDVGEYTVGIRNAVGVTDSISGYGYCMGGGDPSPANIDEIARFSLTSDGDASDVGDLTQSTGVTSGCPSESYAFCVEGIDPSATDLNRLAWTSSGNATDVGEVSRVQNSAKQYPSIHNLTHWYQVGGYTHPATAYADTIDKIAIAAPYPLTDVGEIASAEINQAAASV